MRGGKEVTEFVIMSGPEVHDYLLTIRAQLRAYLSAAFPEYRFSLVSHEGEGMGFMVVPVVGQVSDELVDDIRNGSHAALIDIRTALEAFRPAVAPTVH